MENYERVIFAPDIHAPYQDEKWLASFLKFIKYFKPDTIFIMGDLIDFYAISRFLKDPDRALRLQEEIDCAVNILKQIRYAYLKANIYYIRGNHEYRLQKYLWSNAKELAGLRCIKIETLLELERFRIKYIEQGRLDYHGLVVKHGSLVRKYAAYTAKGEFEKTGKSGVSAHCFDETTELLTKRGWVQGVNLLSSDEVGTMNKKTKQFEWNSINQFFQYENYKELYRIKNPTVDICVTDKHGLIYETKHGKQKEIEAAKMPETKSKMIFYNCALTNSKEQTYKIDKKVLKLLINVITDGNFEQESIRWHLKKERKIEHLAELLNHFNLKYSRNIQKNGNTKIRISCKDSKWIYELLDYKKVVPKWFTDLTPELVEVVLQEYAITDGCKNSSAQNSYQLSSSKEFEIDILQEMFIRNGYRACKIKHSGTYCLTVNNKRRTTSLLKIHCSLEEYDGSVWCVNVNNGTLLTRRNGKVTVTLNTHRGAIYYQSNAGGNYAWMECGCGCQLDAEYLEGETPNWLQGWGVGHLKKTSNRFNLEFVPFVDGKAMYQGKEF